MVISYQYDGDNTQPSLEIATIDGVADYQDGFQYDSQGRLIEITQSGVAGGDIVAEKEIDLSYNDAGLLASIQRTLDGNVVVTSDYTYDSLGRLTSLVYHQGNTVLDSFSWTYSGSEAGVTSGDVVSGLETAVGGSWLPGQNILPVYQTSGITADTFNDLNLADNLITSSTSSLDGTVQYSYDAQGQLTGATYSGAQPNESYSYDANGNRANAGYVTGPDNELSFDGTYSYAYDAEGNRTAKFVDANHDGVLDSGDTNVTEYTWDVRNRLSEVKTFATEGGSPTEIVDYLYDVENRWIGENIDSNGDGVIDHETRFVYDGNQIVLQFDKDVSGATGSASDLSVSDLSHRYLSNPAAVDQLLADEQLLPSTAGVGAARGQGGYDLTQPGTVVWALTDNQNTVRDLAVMDAQTGVTSIANHRQFDSYGNMLGQTNPATGNAAAVDCLFGYTGFAWDQASSTWRSLTRPYDPATGRWTQNDLIGVNGGEANLDRYCGNDPVNASDATGEITRVLVSGDPGTNGMYNYQWKFELSSKHDQTVTLVQHIIADFSGMYYFQGTRRAYINAFQLSYYEIIATVPANQTAVGSIDTWIPAQPWQVTFNGVTYQLYGHVRIQAQVKAFNTADIAGQIAGWAPASYSTKRYSSISMTSGTFASSAKCSFFNNNNQIVEVESNHSQDSYTMLDLRWDRNHPKTLVVNEKQITGILVGSNAYFKPWSPPKASQPHG